MTMRLKSFQADTMTEAMAQVRAVLGEDAIIISTREDSNKRFVKVTAAIEEFEPEQPIAEFEDGDWFSDNDDSEPYDDDMFDDADLMANRPDRSLTGDHDGLIDDDEEDYLENLFAIRDDRLGQDEDSFDFFDFDVRDDGEGDLIEQGYIESVTEALIRHNVPASLTDALISEVISSPEETPGTALTHALEGLYNFKPMPTGRHPHPLLLVGPPGSGKTLSTAKLAAQGVLNDLKIVVITTDTIRAGGIEQLEAFTRVLDIGLITADDPTALAEAIRDNHGADQIIIDTAGVSPFNPEEMKTLSSFIKVADFDTVLVLPAGGDANENADMARSFEILGAEYLMPTRFDISRRYGGILAAAYLANLTFTNGSRSPSVSEGLIDLKAQSLSELLIPNLYEKTKKLKKDR
jgi:flagellar biosynthesis protein FlhF